VRILALNWRDPKNPEAGGAEVHLHAILQRAASMGHQVTQVSHRVHGLPNREVMDGVLILRHGGRNTFNFSVKGFALSLDIAENFDLVLEDLCKIPFYSPAWSPVPVLTVVPHLFGTTAYREVPFPLALYVNIMESFVPKVYADSPFVAISDSTMADLVARGIPAENITVIPCGIDTGFYGPGPPEPEPGAFLYLGRLKKYKGVQFAIRAVKLLRDSGKDAELAVIGTGDYLEELEKLTEKLGLREAVTFHGYVSREKKLRMLRKAWAAVFPSEKEGWGLTVIEANACGSPVVASDSPGLRDSVRNGRTGFLVPHGDPEALARKMGLLMDHQALRHQLGEEGIEWAGSFDWDSTTARMLEAMEKTASGRFQVPR